MLCEKIKFYLLLCVVIGITVSGVLVSAESKKILVNEIAIDNTHNLKKYSFLSEKLEEVISRYRGKALTIEQLKKLVGKITNIYIGAGYVTTKAYLPQQNASSGTLRIGIREGFIEEIKLEGKGKKPTFMPFRSGDILSIRDLEQLYDNYAQGGNSDAQVIIEPGDKLGGSRIVIKGSESRQWNLGAKINNDGSKTNGELVAELDIGLKNLFGQGGLYEVGTKSTVAKRKERKADTVVYSMSIPFGYNSIHYRYSSTNTMNVFQGISEVQQNGSAKTHNISLKRIIFREKKSKAFISLSGGFENYKNHLNERRQSVSSYDLKSLQGELSITKVLEGSVLSGGIKGKYYKHNGMEGSSTNDLPMHKAYKLNCYASWFKPLKFTGLNDARYRLSITGQYAKSILVSSERISISGLHAVRGFKEYREAADSGIILRNTLDHPLWNKVLDNDVIGECRLSYGLDFGAFRSNNINSKNGIVSGASIGFGTKNGMVDLDLIVARALKTPSGYNKNKMVFYFSIGMNL